MDPQVDECAGLEIAGVGVLGRIPLGALPGTEPGTYLLEEWPLVVIPSAQALPDLLDDQHVVSGGSKFAGNRSLR